MSERQNFRGLSLFRYSATYVTAHASELPRFLHLKPNDNLASAVNGMMENISLDFFRACTFNAPLARQIWQDDAKVLASRRRETTTHDLIVEMNVLYASLAAQTNNVMAQKALAAWVAFIRDFKKDEARAAAIEIALTEPHDLSGLRLSRKAMRAFRPLIRAHVAGETPDNRRSFNVTALTAQPS